MVNKKAYHNYFVIEEFLAGMVLTGSEVKSLVDGNLSFTDAYIIFNNGELFTKNLKIAKYKEATYQNHEENRDKKLLLKKKEINKISHLIKEKGMTIVPLELLHLNHKFKLKIGLCKGKKVHDKKEHKKEKDIKRDIQRNNNIDY